MKIIVKKTIILVFLFLALPLFAANEIWFYPYDTGNTIYAIFRNPSDDTVWSDADTAWETQNDANIANYDVSLTDANGDCYIGDFNSSISAGTYLIGVYLQAGGSPAITDIGIGGGVIFWDGSAEITDYTADADLVLVPQAVWEYDVNEIVRPDQAGYEVKPDVLAR